MTGNGTNLTQDQLTLHSRLAEIAHLAPWIEDLASRHGIPGSVRFAMELCLEEVLSNIVRHGYGVEGHGSMSVRFTMPREGYFVFIVDDDAPRFNPLEAPELPPLSPDDETRIGGQGLRLLRGFANTLEYEPTPTGNRLRIGFSADGSSVRTK